MADLHIHKSELQIRSIDTKFMGSHGIQRNVRNLSPFILFSYCSFVICHYSASSPLCLLQTTDFLQNVYGTTKIQGQANNGSRLFTSCGKIASKFEISGNRWLSEAA